MNRRTVTELGAKADPFRDEIRVDGKLVRVPRQSTTLAFHKPLGVVTTMRDPEGRPCVGDLVASLGVRVYPVGRLDYASSGLLILTNDGELAARLMHPRYGVEREYLVKVRGAPEESALGRLARGVALGGKRRAKAEATVIRRAGEKAWLRLILREGRTHEVRRLCAAVGLAVEKLRRVRVGPLKLGTLPRGAWRALTRAELQALRKAVGLPSNEHGSPC